MILILFLIYHSNMLFCVMENRVWKKLVLRKRDPHDHFHIYFYFIDVYEHDFIEKYIQYMSFPFMQSTKVHTRSSLSYNVINQVISYWTSYRSEVSCIGPRPKAEV